MLQKSVGDYLIHGQSKFSIQSNKIEIDILK